MVNWGVGAAINIVGSILINGGTNVMKLGHNRQSALEAEGGSVPPIRKIRAWQFGVGLFIVGNLANFGSFAFAAQSLLAALGSVQFLANVAFGRLILHEPVTKRVLIATALIVAGCIILVSFGNHSSESFTSPELLGFYEKTPYIIYLCLMFTGVVVFYCIYRYGNSLRKSRGQSTDNVPKTWRRLLPISYSVFAALLGTQSVLFSKALSLLLRTTISGNGQLSSWFTWVNLICFILSAAFWVTRLNMALKLFSAAVIVPTMQIAWTLLSITCGMVYYQEYLGFNTLKACMFALGVLVVFVGVFVLTNRPPSLDPFYQLHEDLIRDHPDSSVPPPGDENGQEQESRQDGMDPRDAVLEAASDDDERFPLSPSRAHHVRDSVIPQFERAAISRKSPAAPEASPAATPSKAQAPAHRRGNSFFGDLAADFGISLQQVLGVAEHPGPPYALPAGGVEQRPARDVEMGKAATGAAAPDTQKKPAPAAQHKATSPVQESNPFAGAPFSSRADGRSSSVSPRSRMDGSTRSSSDLASSARAAVGRPVPLPR